jgi:hypothetical protein
MEKKTLGELNLKASVKRQNNVANFYQESFLRLANDMNSLLFLNRGKFLGYRKVRVPVYLTIPIPIIEKHYEYGDFGESCELEGLLITIKWIRLFKIWSKIEKVPRYKKLTNKGSKITFRRYKSLDFKGDMDLKHLSKK